MVQAFRSCAISMALNSLVKRALLGNTKQKIDKSNESFIKDLGLYARKSLFAEPLKFPSSGG